MPQIFREHELNELMHVSKGDGPSTIVVTGPTGAGRSTLLTAAAEETCVPSAIIRANPIEQDWKYSGLSAFLAAIDDALDSNLRSLITLPSDDLTPFEVAEKLDAPAREQQLDPVTVVIDDADLLDSASLEVIGYLLRRRTVKNLRTILSVESVDSAGPLSSFPQIELSIMSVDSLVDLGRSLTSPLAWASVLETIARYSAGNPKSFESMLSEVRPGALYENDALQLPLRPGRVLRKAVEPMLAKHSEDMLTALRVLSCGWSVPLHVIAKVAGGRQERRRGALARRVCPLAASWSGDQRSAPARRRLPFDDRTRTTHPARRDRAGVRQRGCAAADLALQLRPAR